MAAASSLVDPENSMLVCTVCFEAYVEPCIPKNLDCGHVCCKECLKQLLLQTGHGFVKCPECRRKTKVPQGNIDKLPTNFPLKNLAEAEQKQKQQAPRRVTLRRRVTMLRDRVAQHESSCDDPTIEALRLKIECLENQLQEKQSPPNGHTEQNEYTPLHTQPVSQPEYLELKADYPNCVSPISPQHSLSSSPGSEQARRPVPQRPLSVQVPKAPPISTINIGARRAS